MLGRWEIALTALVAASLVVAQTVPVAIVNPPSTGELTAPPRVEAILDRACADCHSNHVRWPWYAKIAPVSWIAAHDVELGRKEINFSEWDAYYPATRKRKLQWIERSIREENMPPWSYRLIHPHARLSETDRAQLERWIESELERAKSSAK
jgi:Haem-binding domain